MRSGRSSSFAGAALAARAAAVTAAAPALLAVAWIAALWGRLALPGVALANRDIAGFHLPLRVCLVRLAAQGWPLWNPWLTGGQPVLSNPNYAALYPPTWLAWPLGALYSLNWLVLLHAAVAFAGAWVLARRLGAGRAAAALAALGYTGSGAYVSLLSSLPHFTGMAWFPWVLAGAVATVERDGPRSAGGRPGWVPAALGCGAAWGMQVLNGDPVCELMSGIAVLVLALATAVRRPRRASRLALALFFALALSAVQLLPAAQRLAGSSRARGQASQRAADWSLPPARLGELVFAHLFGDPARAREGLYFGGFLDPRGEPYVASLYPGLLLAVCGLGALLAGAGAKAGAAVPRLRLRAVWAGGAAAGFLLALGRHNPLNGVLVALLPAFAVQRFPEKYVELAVPCVVFAGALGWQRLMDAAADVAPDAAAARRRASAPAWALSLLVCGAAAAALAVLTVHPGPLLEHLRRAAPSMSADTALAALRREARTALAVALAVAALLTAVRRAWLPARTLSRLAIALLAMDLWIYGHDLTALVPAAEYAAPPRLAASLPAGAPVYVDPAASHGPRVLLAGLPPEVANLRYQLASFMPYTPVLWGIPYALNPDYDVTATRWSQLAIGALEADRRGGSPQLVLRQVGAWGAATVLARQPVADWLRQLAQDPGASPLRAAADPFRLPRLRFVPRVTVHPDYRAALDAARAEGYDAGRSEHCWQPGSGAARTAVFAADATLLALADTGARLRLRYRAGGPAFLVVATTFDEGWSASLDGGRPLPLQPTALAQLAAALPAGEHRLEVVYRERLLPAGAAVTLLALAGAAAALLWSRRPA